MIYTTYEGGIWKVSIDGGAPIKVSDAPISFYPRVSPDGRLLAYMLQNEQKRPQIKLITFEGDSSGTPLKTFDLPVTSKFIMRWSPDGHSIVFVNIVNGVSNLWQQPVNGDAPKRITDFKSEQIWNFAYSRDGKQLALARGETTNDAVLISDVK